MESLLREMVEQQRVMMNILGIKYSEAEPKGEGVLTTGMKSKVEKNSVVEADESEKAQVEENSVVEVEESQKAQVEKNSVVETEESEKAEVEKKSVEADESEKAEVKKKSVEVEESEKAQVDKKSVIETESADDTSKPADDTSKPADDTSKPADDTSKPSDDASKPADDTSKPADDTSKPADDTSKPADDTSKPADDNSKPADDTSKPSDDASKPSDDASKHSDEKSAINNSQPTEESGSGKKEPKPGTGEEAPPKELSLSTTWSNRIIITKDMKLLKRALRELPCYDTLLETLKKGIYSFQTSGEKGDMKLGICDAIICHGIGDFDKCNQARCRLLILKVLKKLTRCQKVWIYAKEFSQMQKKNMLDKYDIGIMEISEIESGYLHRDKTIFFLPGSPVDIYEEVVKANWTKKGLRDIAMIGEDVLSFTLEITRFYRYLQLLRTQKWYVKIGRPTRPKMELLVDCLELYYIQPFDELFWGRKLVPVGKGTWPKCFLRDITDNGGSSVYRIEQISEYRNPNTDHRKNWSRTIKKEINIFDALRTLQGSAQANLCYPKDFWIVRDLGSKHFSNIIEDSEKNNLDLNDMNLSHFAVFYPEYGGKSLKKVLENGKLLPEQLLSILCQICILMSHAEQNIGLVHNEISPRNILIRPTAQRVLNYDIGGENYEIPTNNCIAKLKDFEISRLVENDGPNLNVFYENVTQIIWTHNEMREFNSACEIHTEFIEETSTQDITITKWPEDNCIPYTVEPLQKPVKERYGAGHQKPHHRSDERSIDQNSTLGNYQKLQYLNSALKGNADRLIRAFNISDENYPIAWQTLVNRFDKKSELAFKQIQNLYDLKNVKQESTEDLLDLLDTCNESIQNLSILGLERNNLSDMILIHIIQSKLDRSIRKEWEMSLLGKEYPSYEKMISFLERFAGSLGSFQNKENSKQFYKMNKSTHSHSATFASGSSIDSRVKSCVLCKGEHFLLKCPKFNGMMLPERWTFVKDNRLCYNCLRSNHRVSSCVFTQNCKSCNKRHHTLLHQFKPEMLSPVADISPLTHASVSCFADNKSHDRILLSTALIKVKSENGVLQTCRALIDTGSQRCLITNSCRKKLNLPLAECKTTVFGLGNKLVEQSMGEVSLQFSPHFSNLIFNANPIVIDKITSELPNFFIEKDNWPYLKNLLLADPNFDKSSQIDLVIGAELYDVIVNIQRN
ncbi:hypothetical protein LAZ67_11000773 [Cordylochernes scorpioides]|uniref:Peptidase A2 domain-containing protein n=1 Tax=Cordylochernes scorpioides TaxID=51811 RepID=A0ABY6L0R4_9ARAC|nr:hypothetical protein LAZ67_11000773 [Cordylochernes scorpioides]